MVTRTIMRSPDNGRSSRRRLLDKNLSGRPRKSIHKSLPCRFPPTTALCEFQEMLLLLLIGFAIVVYFTPLVQICQLFFEIYSR